MAFFGEAGVNVEGVSHSLVLNVELENQRLLTDYAFASSGPKAPEKQEGRLIFDFGIQNITGFAIHLPPNTGALALCLAGCIGKSFTGPIIECYLQSKNPKDILACLKTKGIHITSSALACALECLMKHPI